MVVIDMDDIVSKFIFYLKNERNYSSNTINSYEHDINDFNDYLKSHNINDLTKVQRDQIKPYLVTLYDLKYTSSTIARKLSALKSFYKYLFQHNLITTNPFILIKTPKKEKKLPNFLYYNELDILLKTPDKNTPLGFRNCLLLELLYSTGIRVSELVNIKLSDIDFKSGKILINGKGNKERIVLYGDYCRDYLKQYLPNIRNSLLNGHNHPYLLVNHHGEPLTTRGVRSIIDTIIKHSSVKSHVSPHTLRHTFATHLLNEGADILAVKELLGHSSLNSTQIYTHVTNERLREVYLSAHPRAK